ncbi:MAG: GDP-mannose 4,6-dehydratase [Verrucomicrobia bacterium]|nr:GDP-mannose 4,6-dehydratase [Verrucomicrobiota bacterium]
MTRVTWNNTQVLVTGAGGFIGSHLVENLVARGAKVRAFVHYNSRNDWGQIERLPEAVRGCVEVVAGDVRDPFFVRTAVEGRDVVFHLAALIPIPYSYLAPQSFIETNVLGTLNVLEACRAAEVSRLVHTSTSETYGTAQSDAPMTETHPSRAQSPYAASKIGADRLVESYVCSYGVPAVTVRPFNTFGPRQSARAVIAAIATQVLAGRKRIAVGALDPVRDFSYVADTVRGFIAAAELDDGIGEAFNVGSGQAESIREVGRMIIDLCGNGAELVLDNRRVRPALSEVMRLVCDSSKLQGRTGWRPEVGLREGIERTLEYIARHLDEYKTDLYTV